MFPRVLSCSPRSSRGLCCTAPHSPRKTESMLHIWSFQSELLSLHRRKIANGLRSRADRFPTSSTFDSLGSATRNALTLCGLRKDSIICPPICRTNKNSFLQPFQFLLIASPSFGAPSKFHGCLFFYKKSSKGKVFPKSQKAFHCQAIRSNCQTRLYDEYGRHFSKT